jgi:hypothetical protein
VTAVIEEATVAGYTGVLERPGLEDLTWSKDDDAQVKAAAEAFAKTLKETKGAAANQDNVTIREFDPEASTIRMWHQMAGG